MEGIIKVTPEELINTSTEFDATGGTIRNLTSQMVDVVTSLNSVWEGEAANLYQQKFQGLQDDIERMHSMIQEHVKDLIDMANRFKQAETEAAAIAEPLLSDVIV
ncbi:MAG: WXG100 family type VII secretion target [Oscillospiraceae bacterium]|nr:WXG100 family type VII secretion target [Oscillospiraceae bacterium]